MQKCYIIIDGITCYFSVAGKRYFECEMKYGAFVKPHSVTIGDFPELGLDDLMDDDDEM